MGSAARALTPRGPISPHTGRNVYTHKPQKTISAVSNTPEHKLGPTSSALLLFWELRRTNLYHTHNLAARLHAMPRCFWPTCQNSTRAIRRQSPLRDKAGLHKRPSSGRERRHYPGLAAEYLSWREKNGNEERRRKKKKKRQCDFADLEALRVHLEACLLCCLPV